MSLGTDEEKLASEFQERKESIAELLLSATSNYPPMKQDILEIMIALFDLFPDLQTLEDLMVVRRREHSGGMTRFWWDNIPVYDIYKRIEQEIEKKPFNSKRAREVFAYVLWLSFELLFKEDLKRLVQKEEPINEYQQLKRELRAQRIILNIHLANERFRKCTGFSNVQLFRPDVPDFFMRLPTRCKERDDFLACIQSLGSIFDVDLKSLRKIVSRTDPNEGSTKVIHRWLEERRIPGYERLIKIWENIRLLRNAPPTHPEVKPKLLDALEFFGESSSVNFTRLWDSILDRFDESLVKFQEIT